MSLAATVAKSVAVAFGAAGDLVISGVVTRNRPGNFSTTTGGPASMIEEQRIVTMIVGEYSKREVDGDRVHSTDRRFYIRAEDMLPEPRPGDDVEALHQVFHVINVETIRAGTDPVLYDVQARL